MYHARSQRPARPRAAIRVICAGAILGLVTVLASAFDAVSSPQSVALALVSVLTIGGGLLGHFAATILPGLRIAWRRGFQHGLEAGSRAQSVADQSVVLTVVQPDAPADAPAADDNPELA